MVFMDPHGMMPPNEKSMHAWPHGKCTSSDCSETGARCLPAASRPAGACVLCQMQGGSEFCEFARLTLAGENRLATKPQCIIRSEDVLHFDFIHRG